VSDAAADQLFLGRQPILDREQRLHAYELLFRSGSRNFAEVTDGVQATATVIANAFSELGIEAALGSHRGFINVDEAFLFSDMLELLPRHAVVLEILETVPPTRLSSSAALRSRLPASRWPSTTSSSWNPNLPTCWPWSRSSRSTSSRCRACN
jgi:EAL domain-containing protein (putative c-di-GMP-specific phosphodiesterase class I)